MRFFCQLFVVTLGFLPVFVTSCTVSSDGSTLDLSNSGLTGFIDANVFTACGAHNNSDVTNIDLSGNAISDLDPATFVSFYNSRRVSLANNSLTFINKTTFVSLNKLEVLDLSYNRLTTLEAGTFDLFKLRELHLHNNNISTVENGVVGKINDQLVLVNLSHNALTTFEFWPYLAKTSDERRLNRVFDLQYNRISEITNSAEYKYNLSWPFQINVNVQHNLLTNVGLSMLRLITPETDTNALFSKFYSLNLNGTYNPYTCDCKLFELADLVQNGILRWRDVDSYRYRCQEPVLYRDEDWFHDVPLSALVCNRTDDCPANCHCEDRPHNDTFYINCDGAGLTALPEKIPKHDRNKIEMILDNNNIQSLNTVSYMNNIYNLSLSNNKICKLEDDVVDALANVHHFDLQNNCIEKLPRDIQRFNYGKIQLKGNPLRCDCDSMWLSEWLNLYRDDGDMSLRCTSEQGEFQIIDVTLTDLDCTYTDVIIIGVCAALAAVALVVIIAFSRLCPYETKVILYKVFRTHPRDKYKVDADDSKDLDIYLVFDWDDDDVRGWVRCFTSKLQRKKPLYSILNPCRFSDGDGEMNQAATWICKARRIVIILSKDLFRRRKQHEMISIAENNLAEAQAKQNADPTIDVNDAPQDGDVKYADQPLDTAAKIIYIQYNDDAELCRRLDSEPWRSRLADKPVLKHNDRMFWSKLRYELPQQGNGQGVDGNFIPPRAQPQHRPPKARANIKLKIEDETRLLPVTLAQVHGKKDKTKFPNKPNDVVKNGKRDKRDVNDVKGHLHRHTQGRQPSHNQDVSVPENGSDHRFWMHNTSVPVVPKAKPAPNKQDILGVLNIRASETGGRCTAAPSDSGDSDSGMGSGNSGVSGSSVGSGSSGASGKSGALGKSGLADKSGVSGKNRVSGKSLVLGNSGVSGKSRVSGSSGMGSENSGYSSSSGESGNSRGLGSRIVVVGVDVNKPVERGLFANLHAMMGPRTLYARGQDSQSSGSLSDLSSVA